MKLAAALLLVTCIAACGGEGPEIRDAASAIEEADAGPDSDGDGVPDAVDNCVAFPNADQVDRDGDGWGRMCDADDDGDEVLDTIDNCATTPNEDQLDADADGIGDACDLDVEAATGDRSPVSCAVGVHGDASWLGVLALALLLLRLSAR